jgi:prepilin-type N-terminal cleavage/methylation domain-containing protein
MKKVPYSLSAFTLIELLVVISIIAILASLAIPAVTGALTRGQMTGVLNNARQLQIATQTMALDAFTTGDGPGWPGDQGESASWEGLCSSLEQGKYLSWADLRKIATAPGVQIPVADSAPSKTGIQVYAVRESDASDAIYVSSFNWTGFSELNSKSVPFGDKGFVVFRKGGDGSVYQARQATSMAIGQITGAGIAPGPGASE